MTLNFGEELEFVFPDSDLVTNDGITFKLKCMENGRYQNRDFLTCRPRKVCTLPPPRPTDVSGLAFSQSINVPEFEAIYHCKKEGKKYHNVYYYHVCTMYIHMYNMSNDSQLVWKV